jgi:hypothetical protein
MLDLGQDARGEIHFHDSQLDGPLKEWRKSKGGFRVSFELRWSVTGLWAVKLSPLNANVEE